MLAFALQAFFDSNSPESQTLIVPGVKTSPEAEQILVPSGENPTELIWESWALAFSLFSSSVAAREGRRRQFSQGEVIRGTSTPESQTFIVWSPADTIVLPSTGLNATLEMGLL